VAGRRRAGYEIEYSQEAEDDLDTLSRQDRAIVLLSVPKYLQHQPDVELGARERMRPNTLGADWALHLGALRAYYSVDDAAHAVWILRVGEKRGNTLYVRGRPFDLG
jgi:mRNA-degrading endonuclease RelE of RelBE toxin-antitoxin system